jgi:hypothetical protein
VIRRGLRIKVSLLPWSGEDLVYPSEQAGHSVATLATHCAGVISELRGHPRVPAVDAIRQARDEVALGELCDHSATNLTG